MPTGGGYSNQTSATATSSQTAGFYSGHIFNFGRGASNNASSQLYLLAGVALVAYLLLRGK